MSSEKSTIDQPVGGKAADKVFRWVAFACGTLILVVLAAVFLFLFFRAWPLIGGDQNANKATIESFTGSKAHNFWQYVGPLAFGTILVAALALLIAFFVSVGIALFISQYAPKGLATALSTIVDLLAAIPSVIYGLWGGIVLVPAIYPFWTCRQPCPYGRHGGCRLGCHDSADYYLHGARRLLADSAFAAGGSARARCHQVGDD